MNLVRIMLCKVQVCIAGTGAPAKYHASLGLASILKCIKCSMNINQTTVPVEIPCTRVVAFASTEITSSSY